MDSLQGKCDVEIGQERNAGSSRKVGRELAVKLLSTDNAGGRCRRKWVSRQVRCQRRDRLEPGDERQSSPRSRAGSLGSSWPRSSMRAESTLQLDFLKGLWQENETPRQPSAGSSAAASS